MFWLQLGTLAPLNLLVLGAINLRPAGAQHSGAGSGSYTVWQLIALIEAEHREPPRWLEPRFPDEDPDAAPGAPDDDPEPTGRHHLRR